ncbi:MAG: hypothetical protein PHF33_10060 [Candidatus Delongbacteria bacterium]|nr:hypothetical protein [Candidatus Delongbacteria bacterium]MDD4205243.1 hypothetical protein [Candidatus Delongbacteria bacterium]
MIKGIEVFRERLKSFKKDYVIIGGAACDVLMSDAGFNFRVTKDIDIVLLIENMNGDFAQNMWDFIKEGNYENSGKNNSKQYYRFSNPLNENFPSMLEFFSRKPDLFDSIKEARILPVRMPGYVSSLSAILLDDEYYQFIKSNTVEINGLVLASPESLIILKSKAYLDLNERRQKGESIDSRDIKKHKNDIIRLTQLLIPSRNIEIPELIRKDMNDFLLMIENEKSTDPKQLGLSGLSLDDILARIRGLINK